MVGTIAGGRCSPLWFVVVVLLLFFLVPGSSASAVSQNQNSPGPVGEGGQALWSGATAIYGSLRSISMALHSLFQRVASQRLSRGDTSGRPSVRSAAGLPVPSGLQNQLESAMMKLLRSSRLRSTRILTSRKFVKLLGFGAERARNIAATLGSGLHWWTGLGSLSWDYVTNYFFKQSVSKGMDLSQAMHHLSDISSIVGELTRLQSDSERLQWIATNYSRAFAVVKSLFRNLLSVFDRNGAMRNCVMAMQREVLEGDLLRDVLKLGPTDLESLVKISKDVLQRIFAPGPSGPRETEL